MFQDFKIIASSMGDLPPSPAVAARLLKELKNPNLSVKDLAKLVSVEPAVTAKIMKMANSALYGQLGQITTLERAIIVIGENNLKRAVMDISLRNVNKSHGLLERWLWENSVGCAVGARLAAERLSSAPPEEAFIAGLFRHIGKTIMLNRDRDLYRKVVKLHERGEVPLHDGERALFAFSHEMVGAALLEHWNFPPRLVSVVRHHHDFESVRESDPEVFHLAATVSLGAEFCRYFGIGPRQKKVKIDLPSTDAARSLGLTMEELEPLLDEFIHLFHEERSLFLA
ncbi:HDOD domain-containing protein [uncultured Desulfuromonas sp.]|uniref:HDOD domain-containing protein n=1 Tax=uncultured Desulfuromonas sp. TaxID=181013 RepID=UPI00260AFEFE|nr:HDOD domain-containing protein [uncultured Desulfuromonas sp.]